MHFYHGIYHFSPKRIAYRNDYCLTCDTVRVAEQIETFDAWHVWFIPLIPFGRRKHWKCTICKRNPHERAVASQGVKKLSAGFSGLFTLFGIVVTIGMGLTNPKDLQEVWPSLLVFIVVMFLWFVASLLWCLTKPPVNLHDRLLRVPPLPMDRCYFCDGYLDGRWFCSHCQVSRAELAETASGGFTQW